jgi:hypothetical protein
MSGKNERRIVRKKPVELSRRRRIRVLDMLGFGPRYGPMAGTEEWAKKKGLK